MLSKLTHNLKFIFTILFSLLFMVCCTTSLFESYFGNDEENIVTEDNLAEEFNQSAQIQNDEMQLSNIESNSGVGTHVPSSKPISTNTSEPINTTEPAYTPFPTRTSTPIPPTSIPPTSIPPTSVPATIPPVAAVSTGSVEITYIYYDGQVKTVESDEYAVITNTGSTAVNLSGWRLNADDNGQDFWFPNYTLNPNQSCRVYTNEIHTDTCGFSFRSGSAIWKNSGECGYLFDASGKQVSSKCY